MSMETNETDLDLIYMSDWSAEMHIHDGNQPNQPTNKEMVTDIPPMVSYANVFPGVRDDNDGGETVASNAPMPFGGKKNVIPTIATIYEPKFFEIYQQYYQHILHHEPELIIQNPNQHHLMTLCLNYLLSFSNWARDAVNGNWIRASLFENPDMRPEVRNGLAMIIVYVFASARAADARAVDPTSNTDMFTVLMKAESGMGIVNKTSLKIYSDPFGYFNFIKTCISGLIDASAIPENERISTQATKKSRRGSRNKDEVEAYEYVKTQLMAMFQSPDSLQLAKDRINQILEFWHVRGKVIRNERFTSVFSLPPPVPGSSNSHLATMFTGSTDGTSNVNSSSNPIFNSMSAEYITIPGRLSNGSTGGGSGARTSNRSSQGSGHESSLNNSGLLPMVTANASNPFAAANYPNANTAAFPTNNPNAFTSYPHMSVPPQQQQQQTFQFHQLQTQQHQQQQSGQIPSHLQVNDNDSVVSDSGMSSASRSPHPSFLDYHSSSARSSGAMNFRYTNTTNVSMPEEASALTSARPTEVSISFYQTQQFLQQQVQQIATSMPIPALRFDRQGMLSWSVTTSLIYEVDTLLQQNQGRTHYYLVDEQKLKRFLATEIVGKNQSFPTNPVQIEEELMKASTFPLQVTYAQAATGFNSLEKMLLKSGSLTTSWQGAMDAAQLRVFVEGWRNHVAVSIVQQNYNNGQSNSGKRSASNSLVLTSPPLNINNNNNNSNNTNAAEGSNNTANSNTSMNIDDNASTVSGSSRQPRLSRRRTSNGPELKRDMTKLALQLQQQDQLLQFQQQQQQQQQQQSFPPGAAFSFSPPKAMSPMGPSPSFTFGKTFNNNNNNNNYNNNNNNPSNSSNSNIPPAVNPPQPQQVLTSPLAGTPVERKSFNNNNNNSLSSGQNVMTMLDYWQFLVSGNQLNNGTVPMGLGRGILVFERSNEVGLVVRANAQYGLVEDVWCLYYPDDALQQFLSASDNSQAHLAQSFAAYLMLLLPQTRQLMKYLAPSAQSQQQQQAQQGMHDHHQAFWMQNGPITVSYFAHTHLNNNNNNNNMNINNNNNMNNSYNNPMQHTSGPPLPPSNMNSYRTIGSLEQNAHVLLSKLASDAYFHEIVLY